MENKIGGDLICRRPEAIIEARFNLTKRQNDILDMVFATIENDNKLRYDIDLNKYSQLYNIKDKSNIYRDLKKAVISFEGKGFSIAQKIDKKKENRIYFNWFSHIAYFDGESKIIVALDPILKELMLNAKKACFYQIKYTLNFHNIYSKRLYYYLKSYENSNKDGTGWRVDNLNELRTKLDCPKTYDIYYQFKRYVLKIAYDEINGNSDIAFEYKENKIKGKVTSLKFYIKSNKKIEKSTSLFSTPDDEVTATLMNPEEDNSIRKIMDIMSDSKITTFEAKELSDTANGDINKIKEKYVLAQNVIKIDSVVGWMIKAIKNDYQAPKNKIKNGAFNSYEQRPYDSELEKKLLGWGEDETIQTTGEEFQQLGY